MSDALHPTSCHCCEGLDVETPQVIDNPPSLNAIAYRTGTHASFRETVLALISMPSVPPVRSTVMLTVPASSRTQAAPFPESGTTGR